jgi:UDP-N-acetylglucosamine acyltransferase
MFDSTSLNVEFIPLAIDLNCAASQGKTLHCKKDLRSTKKQATAKLKTTIGDNCLLMTYVHIAHDCQIGNHVILASYTGLSGHVTIDDWAILEGKVAAQQFTHIGKHAFIGGASLIRKDVPPYVKAAREPLSFAGVNSVGLRRRGFSEEQVREIEDLYRILYVQNSNVSKGIKIVEDTMPESPLRAEIIGFIKTAENGVIRGMI